MEDRVFNNNNNNNNNNNGHGRGSIFLWVRPCTDPQQPRFAIVQPEAQATHFLAHMTVRA